mgnify:CR=1 FL=1
MAGLWYEEFKVGMEFKHPLTRTITEMDNVMFCALTHNPQPLHLDAEAAKASEFGQILVNGTFTFALMVGLSVGEVEDMYRTMAIANYEDRFVIPPMHREEAIEMMKEPHEHRSPQVRQLLIACKRRGLPAFLYRDEQAWRLQDRRRSIPITRDVTHLRGQQPRGYTSRAKNYLEDWIELLHKKATSELTRSADRLRYNLRYYGHPGEDQNLSVEIGNARKPDSGASRRSAIEILNYMRSHDMHTTGQFRDWIAKKWDDIVSRERETKQATESARPRTVATKQAMTTSRLYRNEDLIEQVWDMKRPRSLQALQAALDLLWDHYAERLGTRMLRPELQFGPGTKYHGRHISYTQSLDRGQKTVLAPGERNFYVLVHELSHALGPSEHGIRFARVYHDLLNHDTFKTIMSTPRGQEFLEYLRVEHPRQVRRIYRRR